MLYLFLLGGFGTLVGLLMLREEEKLRRTRGSARQPSSAPRPRPAASTAKSKPRPRAKAKP